MRATWNLSSHSAHVLFFGFFTVTDFLVKASDDIICDPRQASNCVEKGEDKTAHHPRIGVLALIFTLWLTEASFWNASAIAFRSGGAVAGEDILLHCSEEGEQLEFCLTCRQQLARRSMKCRIITISDRRWNKWRVSGSFGIFQRSRLSSGFSKMKKKSNLAPAHQLIVVNTSKLMLPIIIDASSGIICFQWLRV